MSNDLSSGTKLVLPSAHSAFKKIEYRSNVAPSVARCVNLFESDGKRVNDMLLEETHRQQTAFQIRWSCRCDAMSTSRRALASSSLRHQKPRAFDWKPISQTKEDVPCLLKRFALAKISVENVDNDSSRLPFPRSVENRPDSPVPFRLARIENCAAVEPDASDTPSLFHLDRTHVAMTTCGEDQEIAAASTSNGDENQSRATPAPCLTPPHSPLKARVCPRYTLRNRHRQAKLTGK